MRKFVSLLCVLLMCMTLVIPAFAAEDTFVPSITYKDGPDIEEAVMDGKDVTKCLVVSSLKEAKEKSTDISQESRDLLQQVYEELKAGEMKLPVEEENLVVRELVDVSFKEKKCIGQEHGHKEWLAEEGNTITITFDAGVSMNTKVTVMVYVNGQWTPVESVVNNGDGTITCVFEDICPVAFCVDAEAETPPSQTGDEDQGKLIWWVIMMAVAIVAVVVLVLNRRKFTK